MGTLHATYSRDTLTRMETMAMMSDIEMPLAAMRAQTGSGIEIIVPVARLRDGSCEVTRVTEVMGFDIAKQAYDMQALFSRRYLGMTRDHCVCSQLVPTGALPTFLDKLEEHGVKTPVEMIRCAAAAKSKKEVGRVRCRAVCGARGRASRRRRVRRSGPDPAHPAPRLGEIRKSPTTSCRRCPSRRTASGSVASTVRLRSATACC